MHEPDSEAFGRRKNVSQCARTPPCASGFSMSRLEGREQLGAEDAVDDAVVAGERRRDPARRRRRRRPPSRPRCRSAAPTARMVACGGLMIAENSMTPCMPRLEIVVVPPLYSSGWSAPSRARARKRLHLVRDGGERLRLGGVDHRRDQPVRHRDGDGDVGMLELRGCRPRPDRVGPRHRLQRQRQRLDHEVVDRELVGGVAVGVLAARRR